MTDIKDRFARMLAGEPAAESSLDGVVTAGRRALRRHNAVVAVAGVAGTAAVTAAVVVPLTIQGGNSAGGASTDVTVASQPTASATTKPCEAYYLKHVSGQRHYELKDIQRLARKYRAQKRPVSVIESRKLKGGARAILVCTKEGSDATTPGPTSTPSTPPAPRYHYRTSPQHIADGFASQLASDVGKDNLTIVYSRPFAQESATLEKGHPSYYDDNVDVTVGSGQGDIGVQVTHQVTTMVPFDGACKAPKCTETTLADGSVIQTSRIHAGSDGAQIIAVEIHHADGLVVQAQMSNYGFGPNAPTHERGNQPLTMDQLTAIAEDPAFSF